MPLGFQNAIGETADSRDWRPSKNHSSKYSKWAIAGDSLRRVRPVCDLVRQPAKARLDWRSGNSQESCIMRICL
jgi:hypothetical protein